MNEQNASITNAGGAAGMNVANPSAGRILLVDDDPINQMVLGNLLKRRGWEAVAAGNGKEALVLLARQRFDLIIMDLQMPEMDGFQTTRAIRETETGLPPGPTPKETATAIREKETDRGTSHTPIIALTTISQSDTREKCLAVGMDDYLTKPIKPPELFAAVEKHLAKRTA